MSKVVAKIEAVEKMLTAPSRQAVQAAFKRGDRGGVRL